MTELQCAIEAYANFMGMNIKEAKDEVEKIIAANMQTEGWTREFAESSFIEDTLDDMEETVDGMTQAAKENGTDKITAKSVDAYGKKRTRTRKPNEEKRALIAAIANFCDRNEMDDLVEHWEIVNNERQIDIFIENRHYSLVLTQHRPKKDKN